MCSIFPFQNDLLGCGFSIQGLFNKIPVLFLGKKSFSRSVSKTEQFFQEYSKPMRTIDRPGGRERLYCFPLFAHGQLITTSVTSHSNRSKLSLAWLV